ncbi:MAG: hypothetical protein AAF591_21825 [Verrucomicrobiota bacterium]
MNSKLTHLSPSIFTLQLFAVAALLASGQTGEPKPPSRPATTWQDLGFNQLPEGFAPDLIPLMEGLNRARGTWSFEGEMIDGDGTTSFESSLQITGDPKSGMLPTWGMNWSWPADDPEHTMGCVIMAGPRKGGFDLILTRIGPLNPSGTNKSKPRPAMFGGKWNLENRTITWTERAKPTKGRDQSVGKDSSKPMHSFEMVVTADGHISIQNSEHTPQEQIAAGKALIRTAEAPVGPKLLTGEHQFKTLDEITDPRIKPCLPPQATGISLLSERGGHYARYQVKEKDFMNFLDTLWEAKKDSSAHKRGEMGGEGEPAGREALAKTFRITGWKPLGDMMVYFGPSKPSGAMTTYYYNRETGTVFHERGYW